MAPTLLQLPPALARHADPAIRRLPAVAGFVLAALLAIASAELIWLIVPRPDAARWRPAPVVSTSPATSTGPNIERIANASLLGRFDLSTQSLPLEDAPDTRLNLKLLGVLAATEDRSSRALINNGTDEKPYSIGDAVIRGAEIKAIYADRVILLRDGKPETLRLEKNSTGALIATRSRSPVDDAVDVDAVASLQQIRDQLLQDPSRASDFIRVQPQNSGGQMRGYRIFPGRDRSLFNEAGLRPGDLVTAVNGIELNDPANALQLLNDLSQATGFSLTIERQGRPQTVDINLN